jgi:hypothetical protein
MVRQLWLFRRTFIARFSYQERFVSFLATQMVMKGQKKMKSNLVRARQATTLDASKLESAKSISWRRIL